MDVERGKPCRKSMLKVPRCAPDDAVLSSTAFSQVSTPDACEDSPRCKSMLRRDSGCEKETQAKDTMPRV